MVSFKEHYLGLQTNQINVPQQAGFVNAFNSIGDFYGAICVAQVERNDVAFSIHLRTKTEIISLMAYSH